MPVLRFLKNTVDKCASRPLLFPFSYQNRRIFKTFSSHAFSNDYCSNSSTTQGTRYLFTKRSVAPCNHVTTVTPRRHLTSASRNDLEAVASLLVDDAKSILVMTGAGISTASGIPDFR